MLLGAERGEALQAKLRVTCIPATVVFSQGTGFLQKISPGSDKALPGESVIRTNPDHSSLSRGVFPELKKPKFHPKTHAWLC